MIRDNSQLLLILLSLILGATGVSAQEPSTTKPIVQKLEVQLAQTIPATTLQEIAPEKTVAQDPPPNAEPEQPAPQQDIPPAKEEPATEEPKQEPAQQDPPPNAEPEQPAPQQDTPPAKEEPATEEPKQQPAQQDPPPKAEPEQPAPPQDTPPAKEEPATEEPKQEPAQQDPPPNAEPEQPTPPQDTTPANEEPATEEPKQEPGEQQQAAKETPQKKGASAPPPTLPPAWINQLHWRSIGPANMSGRIPALAVNEKDPNVWWAASASGGLLKTVNNGTTFEYQFDREATVSMGDVQVAPSDPNIVWVGTGEANPRNSVSWGDGVYKSTDGGKSWKNMGLKKTFQIGRMAIHPRDPNIVYVGALGRLWGPNEDRGLYKTIDGGETWKKILYIDDKTGVIDVQINPKNPEIVIVATYERERDAFDGNDPAKKFGPGSGVYLTTDGGETFQKATKGLPDCQLGRIGISIYRKDPRQVYLVLESEKIGQVPEKAGYAGIRGEDADIGARLVEVVADGPAAEAGLQSGDIVYAVEGKIIHSYEQLIKLIDARREGDKLKLTVSRDRKELPVVITLAKRPPPEQPQRRGPAPPQTPQDKARLGSKYADSLGGQRENQEQGPDAHHYGGIYHSKDGGMSWQRINSLNPRPMYYSQIRVDPSNNKNIWVLGTSLYLSKDGGVTFTSENTARGIHVDHHSLWIDPNNGNHVILGNDGGIHVTYDQGLNWDHLNHVAIGQFYHVAVGPQRDYRVFGGLQDNGSWGGPHRGPDGSGTTNTDWFSVGGGDGFVCAVDPEDPDQVYSESQGGATGRYNLRTGARSSMRPQPPRDTQYRFNWKTPFILSPHNSRVYYSAGNYVFRSPYKGNDLRAISPEITVTDKGSASALAESPAEEGVLYVGTTDGTLWVTKDGGHVWANLYGKQPGDLAGEGTPKKDDHAAPQTVAKSAENAQPPQPVVENDIVSGTWEGHFESENLPAERTAFTLVLRRDQPGHIQGSYKSTESEGAGEGKFTAEKSEVSLAVETERSSIDVSGTISGTEMAGNIDVNSGVITLPFKAKRQGAAPELAETASSPSKASEGKSLQELLPGPRWVSSIEASRFKRGRVYITCDGHRSNDDNPYLFVSEDYGHSWQPLLANLPDSIGSTWVIREDVQNENVLYLGTEFSIWVSIDRGRSWTRLNSNLPTVAVHELAIHPSAGEIVAATHGRSLWVLDVSALRQLSAATVAAEVSLYQPQPAVKWRSQPRRGSAGTRQFFGENPPNGATIYYSLAKDAGTVTLSVTDVEGKVLRELEGDPKAGLHSVRWDLQSVRPTRGSGNNQQRSNRGRRGGTVPSGKYLVTLQVDDQEFKTVLTVEDDPTHPPQTN